MLSPLRLRLRALVLVLVVALALVACSDVTTELIGLTHGSERDASSNAATDARAVDAQAAALACDGRPCACNDGIDQDADELIDGLDPECTGPFDDDESSFGTGRPTTVAAGCQDCFWDDNQDSSDDACSYPLACTLPDSTVVADPACSACQVASACSDRCRPSTPNGCDCFGCCEVTTKNGGTVNVVLAEGCSVKDVADVQACPRCTPTPSCRNTCGTCELCLGRKRRDLPMSCRGKPNEDPIPTCDDGERTCSDTVPCPIPFYCRLGCCLVTVI